MHCNSGKGRAGTACCSLLYYIRFYNDMRSCAKYFGHRRFDDDKGISQPCQVRFIHYFEAFIKRIIKSPSIKILKGIKIVTVPKIYGGTVRPYFNIYQVNGVENDNLFDYKLKFPD